jgi:hypothetical protein
MLYAISAGASIHDPGPFTLGLLQDIGWTTVSPSAPSIGFAPASLTPSCQVGQNAASQTFEVWNSGGGTLNYSLSDNQTWLACTPTSGTSTGGRATITVNYTTSGLAAGNYNAVITITASGASNSPQTIPVTLTVNKQGLVAYYPFNGNANDASGNGHNGTVYGATLTQDRFGKANSAYYFNGVDNYIDCGNPDDFNFGANQDFTIACWIQSTMTPSWYPMIISKEIGAVGSRIGFNIFLSNDAKMMFEVYNPTQGAIGSVTGNDGGWHHIVGVRRGSTQEIYIDGTFNVSCVLPSLSISNSTSLSIGKHTTNNTFNRFKGSIDEVRIYKGALSASEIQALYHAGEKPAVAWDVEADFSLAANPNLDWRYGYSSTLTGTLNLYTVPANNSNGLQTWNTGVSDPCADRNANASPVNSANITWPAHSFSLHPGPSGEFSHARWTSPRNGIYTIEATFSGFDATPTSTDVHVLINGVSVFNSLVNGYGSGSAKTYSSGPISLLCGQTVDFAVGYGSNANYHYDTTGLAAKIKYVNAAVPGVMMLLLGN